MSMAGGAWGAWWLLATLLAVTRASHVGAQTVAGRPTAPGADTLTRVLQFVYTTSHAVGQVIVGAIQAILPQAQILADLADPIGFLAILTVFVLLAGVARRVAWVIVAVGWVLMGARVVLAILKR